MFEFFYPEPRHNPEYKFFEYVSDINENFRMLSGTSSSLPYLPTSGGTVTGNTIFTQGVTASTISTSILSAGTIFSGSTNLYNIFQPLGANSIIGNGVNTYTGGSFFNQTVNVSALTINSLTVSGSSTLNSFTATTLSAGTINSGSTNLYSIFQPLGATANLAISNGLNTYTGGTTSNPTINISALTINSLIVSGNTNLSTTTATTLSANTIVVNNRVYSAILERVTANSATTINCINSNYFDYTLSSNTTFTVSNSVNGQTTIVSLTQATNNSGLTATWTAGSTTIKWQGANTPVQSPASGKTDIYTFVQMNGILYGVVSPNF